MKTKIINNHFNSDVPEFYVCDTCGKGNFEIYKAKTKSILLKKKISSIIEDKDGYITLQFCKKCFEAMKKIKK